MIPIVIDFEAFKPTYNKCTGCGDVLTGETTMAVISAGNVEDLQVKALDVELCQACRDKLADNLEGKTKRHPLE